MEKEIKQQKNSHQNFESGLQKKATIKFFTDADNFEEIIKKHVANIKEISLIQTGWTNFVFKVISNDACYIFRFPRNDFFSDALIKDFNFCNFIRDKISLRVPDLKLCYFEDRPYTLHKLIEGCSLSDCYASLTKKEKETLAEDVARLLHQISSIKIDSHKNFNFQLVSNFLDNLSLVAGNNYDLSKHDFLKELENKNLVISHGDLNPGNLILKDNKLVAVIDFAFSGVSSPIVDLSRLIGRTPSEFRNLLINAFEKKFCYKIDDVTVTKLEELWRYVEEKYTLYIKQNHPSIVLPSLV